MAGAPSTRRTLIRRLVVTAWLAAAVLTWNTVYGTYMHWGVLECIARQEQFAKGQGPRIDIDRVMAAALRKGALVATGATALLLAPGLVFLWRRRR